MKRIWLIFIFYILVGALIAKNQDKGQTEGKNSRERNLEKDEPNRNKRDPRDEAIEWSFLLEQESVLTEETDVDRRRGRPKEHKKGESNKKRVYDDQYLMPLYSSDYEENTRGKKERRKDSSSAANNSIPLEDDAKEEIKLPDSKQPSSKTTSTSNSKATGKGSKTTSNSHGHTVTMWPTILRPDLRGSAAGKLIGATIGIALGFAFFFWL